MNGDFLSRMADCLVDGISDVLTGLPFLHTHIRQFIQPSVFPSVQSVVSVVTSGPAWLQRQLKQLIIIPSAYLICRAVYRSFVSETRGLIKRFSSFSDVHFNSYCGHIRAFAHSFGHSFHCLSAQPVSRRGLIAGGSGQSAGQPVLQSVGWTFRHLDIG